MKATKYIAINICPTLLDKSAKYLIYLELPSPAVFPITPLIYYFYNNVDYKNIKLIVIFYYGN